MTEKRDPRKLSLRDVKLTKELTLDRRKLKPLSDDIVDNREKYDRHILKCHRCDNWYQAVNFPKDYTSTSAKYRKNRSMYCASCTALKARRLVNKQPKPTKEEYKEYAEEYWAKKEDQYREQYSRAPRRIPKELHRNRHYKKVKDKLENMTTRLEEQELLTQIKDKHLDLAKRIEEETGIVINYNHDNAFKLLGSPMQVAKKVAKYIKSTKLNPDLTDKQREKAPHFEAYGLAQSIGLDINQLNRILNADVELADDVAIKGILVSAMNQMKSYTLNLALDKNTVAKDVLKEFADQSNWKNDQDQEGNSVKIEAQTLENILNHLTETKLETIEIEPENVKDAEIVE